MYLTGKELKELNPHDMDNFFLIKLVPENRHIKEPGPYPYPYILPPVQFEDPCLHCPSHPINGGTGICHCTIPYFHREQTPKMPFQRDYIATSVNLQ